MISKLIINGATILSLEYGSLLWNELSFKIDLMVSFKDQAELKEGKQTTNLRQSHHQRVRVSIIVFNIFKKNKPRVHLVKIERIIGLYHSIDVLKRYLTNIFIEKLKN